MTGARPALAGVQPRRPPRFPKRRYIVMAGVCPGHPHCPPASPARDRSRTGQKATSLSTTLSVGKKFLWVAAVDSRPCAGTLASSMLTSWERAVTFVQRESGHPSGRRPGSRNTTTLLCEAILETQGEGLARTLVNLAKGTGPTALRLCIDRIMPRGASRPILFALPRVDSAAAARQAVADVIQGMTRAELAPREGNELLKVIERGAKIIATAETAEAAAREGQPRHIQVSWVGSKDIKIAWKAYWREQYEALYGPLPEPPDPEEGGRLPPEKTPAADKTSAAADPGRGAPVPSPAVAGYRTR